jgi:hypothetical protein
MFPAQHGKGRRKVDKSLLRVARVVPQAGLDGASRQARLLVRWGGIMGGRLVGSTCRCPGDSREMAGGLREANG